MVDPFGTVIDVFGVVGEDGSGTNHEFEDGRAFRNLTIESANPNYTFSEWIIYNDSGDAGTINQPQIAPQDFSRGMISYLQYKKRILLILKQLGFKMSYSCKLSSYFLIQFYFNRFVTLNF